MEGERTSRPFTLPLAQCNRAPARGALTPCRGRARRDPPRAYGFRNVHNYRVRVIAQCG